MSISETNGKRGDHNPDSPRASALSYAAGLDDALNDTLQRARQIVANLEPGQDPLMVLYKQIWGESQHDERVLTIILAHMILRLLKAEQPPEE